MLRIYKFREDFYTGTKIGNTYYAIMANPSFKEMREVAGSDDGIRFIADNTDETLYVANVMFVHNQMAQHIYHGGMSTLADRKEHGDVLSGVATQQGKAFVFDSHDIYDEIIEEGGIEDPDDAILQPLLTDWGWLDHYRLHVEDYIDTVLQYIDHKEKTHDPHSHARESIKSRKEHNTRQ